MEINKEESGKGFVYCEAGWRIVIKSRRISDNEIFQKGYETMRNHEKEKKDLYEGENG